MLHRCLSAHASSASPSTNMAPALFVCESALKTENASGLTFDSTLSVELGAEHPQTEKEHGDGQDNANAKTNTPDGREVILSSRRQDN